MNIPLLDAGAEVGSSALILLSSLSAGKAGAYLSIALVSSVKYLVAVLIALGNPGFGFWDIMISAGGGAILGSVIFAYFGAEIRSWAKRYIKPKKQASFARRRRIYQIWHRYGLLGVVAIAPVISPMVSISIALSFGERPRRILLYMISGLLIYTSLLALSKELILRMLA